MAHTRIVDTTARIIDQCSKGRFIRNVNSVSYVAAYTRSGNVVDSRVMADIIQNESGVFKTFFVAPSDGKIESVMFQGSPWPIMNSGGYIQAQIYRNGLPILEGSGYTVAGHNESGFKNTLSGHWVTLNSGVCYDAAINTSSGYGASFTAGQAIYSLLSMNNAKVSNAGYITVSVEWIPEDKSYAGS